MLLETQSDSLEVFTRHTHWNRRGKPPVMRLSRTGHIRLSVEAVKILGLQKGDRISFIIDKRDNGIFYFYVDKENGMPLKFCTRGKGQVDGLQICCRPLSQKLLDHFGYKDPKTFDISSEKSESGRGLMWFVLKEKVHKPIKWKI